MPKPYATSNADIMENLIAGMNQMDLHNTTGWEDLESLLVSGQITASSIDPVESLSGNGPYWLVTLRAYGQPFAQALVSRTGWLLSIMRAQPGLTVPQPHSMRWAGEVAASLGHASPRLRRVHMVNNLTRTSGSADYYPFFEITAHGRETLYLTQEGSVFKLDPQGAGIAFWKDGMRKLTRIR